MGTNIATHGRPQGGYDPPKSGRRSAIRELIDGSIGMALMRAVTRPFRAVANRRSDADELTAAQRTELESIMHRRLDDFVTSVDRPTETAAAVAPMEVAEPEIAWPTATSMPRRTYAYDDVPLFIEDIRIPDDADLDAPMAAAAPAPTAAAAPDPITVAAVAAIVATPEIPTVPTAATIPARDTVFGPPEPGHALRILPTVRPKPATAAGIAAATATRASLESVRAGLPLSSRFVNPPSASSDLAAVAAGVAADVHGDDELDLVPAGVTRLRLFRDAAIVLVGGALAVLIISAIVPILMPSSGVAGISSSPDVGVADSLGGDPGPDGMIVGPDDPEASDEPSPTPSIDPSAASPDPSTPIVVPSTRSPNTPPPDRLSTERPGNTPAPPPSPKPKPTPSPKPTPKPSPSPSPPPPPISVFITSPSNGSVGSVDTDITFSCSASPSSSGVTFSWTFGDGGSATGATVTHSYAVGGGSPYTARCTGDNGSSTDSDNVTITID